TEVSVNPSEASVSWRSGRLFPGNYATRFRLSDAAGNVRHAGPFWWRVERSRPGRVWTHVPGSGGRVALTIDDCHFPGAWSSMLSTLEERNAGATFFCPGKEMLEDPGLVRRTIRDGHVIGSHGWDHANLARMPADAVTRRLRSDARALWKIAHRTTAPYMRPPEGAYTRSTIAASGKTSHPRVILWDVDTRDWTSPGVSTIVSRAVHGARRGSIILLHTKPQTAAALPAIISGLRERGLEPVGVPELFRAAH
ncbi:MAG: polysaccharide deacetylase family protein, partial [Actinomycetota bacterium]|nr:polysaccharide deacetylase family protein [Actinomycetota bacterium]